jgi:hypothetical protein
VDKGVSHNQGGHKGTPLPVRNYGVGVGVDVGVGVMVGVDVGVGVGGAGMVGISLVSPDTVPNPLET